MSMFRHALLTISSLLVLNTCSRTCMQPEATESTSSASTRAVVGFNSLVTALPILKNALDS